MNRTDEAKLKMYNAVISFCSQNMTVLSSVPALHTTFDSFRQIVASIENVAQQKAEVISGVAENKKHLRNVLIKKAAGTAAILLAYASAVNDLKLKGTVKFKAADLARLKVDELAMVSQNIAIAMQSNLTALASYGVTAANITDINSAIDKYKEAAPETRNAVSKRSKHVKALKELFIAGDAVLKNQMDNIVLNLEATNADFHSEYISNRVIVGPSVFSTQLKGTVSNSSNNEPVSGVVVTATNINATGNPITAITNLKGNYLLKLAPGTYSLQLTKRTFITANINDVTVKLGQSTTSDVAMELSVPE